MPQLAIFTVVKFLHDLFTAMWIGGLITLGLTVLPAAREAFGAGPQTKKLMEIIQKRHSILVYVSILGLIITGFLQARQSPDFQGLLSFGNAYSAALAIKHIIVLVMVFVALYRSLVLGRRGTATSAQTRLNAGLLFLNLVLGLVVLLLSWLGAALGEVSLGQ